MTITANILLVDDVEYSRELLRVSLIGCINELKEDIDVHFFHSASGLDILDEIEKHKINLIYLDIELPKTSGIDVLREIRLSPLSDVMVIMVSGESSAENVTAAIEIGANGFIVKPFNAGRILDSIQNFVKKEHKK